MPRVPAQAGTPGVPAQTPEAPAFAGIHDAAVVFDVGRVLFEWDLRHLYAKLIADPAELDWFLAHVVTEAWHFQSDRGRAPADIVAERIAEYPDHAALIEAYRERFSETLPRPVPGMIALVARLAERGVPLFALTNFGAEFFAAFRATEPVFALFRDIVVSGDEHCVKPEPRIYEIAEARFGFAPEALLFVDDNPANIAAAAARGWHTHLFVDAPMLERALVALGLL